jgi:hypothetical protein
MATFTVRQGKRYRATIQLGSFERFATNAMIASRLQAAGFAEVQVEGEGATRQAQAVWPGPDTTADVPRQVIDLSEA